jgi:hypothetical protein
MDRDTLLAGLEFSRARLLGTLTAIGNSGQDPARVLAWRPGPGRAHIAWQAMHCAATHDRYLHVALMGQSGPSDPALVAAYGGGSTPSDQNVPTLADIQQNLAKHYDAFKGYIAKLSPADLDRVVGPPDRRRSIGDSIVLMTWHEAHHQGQIHLTWNLYKQAHGIK